MEGVFSRAVGRFCEPLVWPPGYVLRNMDMVAFARLSRNSAGHEGRRGYLLFGRQQPIDRPWLALFIQIRGGTRLALLRRRGFQRTQSMVAGDAGRHALPPTHELSAAAGEAGE